jgi:hypothetical protein
MLIEGQILVNRESSSWLKHAGAASRLVQLRGSHRFNSDFEKAVLMAHVPSMVRIPSFPQIPPRNMQKLASPTHATDHRSHYLK